MRQPAGAPCCGKDGHKGVAGKTDGIEQQRRVDLDVWLQGWASRLQACEGRGDAALDLSGEGEPADGGAQICAELFQRLSQQRGARIAEPEYPVAKPHQALAGRELLLGPGGDIAARFRLVE